MSVIFVCLYINDVNAITQISRDRQVLLTCMKGAKPVVLDSQAALGHDANRGTHYIFREYAGSGDGSLIYYISLNNAVVSFRSYLTYSLTLQFVSFTLYIYSFRHFSQINYGLITILGV